MFMFYNLPAKTDEFESLTHTNLSKINTHGATSSHSQMTYMNDLEEKQHYSEERRSVLHLGSQGAVYLQTGRITQ